MSPFKFLSKVFLILLITAGGAAVTCGGNMILSNVGILGLLGDFALYFWFLEIGMIGIWAIWRVFYYEKSKHFSPL